MSGMEHAIEQAARAEAVGRYAGASAYRSNTELRERDAFTSGAEWAVGHLHSAGLLAPAPLREEWGIEWADGSVWDGYRNKEEAAAVSGSDDAPVCRWLTGWEKA